MTDFVTQICGALEKTGSNNTKDIKEATDFLQQVSFFILLANEFFYFLGATNTRMSH